MIEGSPSLNLSAQRFHSTVQSGSSKPPAESAYSADVPPQLDAQTAATPKKALIGFTETYISPKLAPVHSPTSNECLPAQRDGSSMPLMGPPAGMPDAVPAPDHTRLPHTYRPAHDPLMHSFVTPETGPAVPHSSPCMHPQGASIASSLEPLPNGTVNSDRDGQASSSAQAVDSGQQQPGLGDITAEIQLFPAAKRQKLEAEPPRSTPCVEFNPSLQSLNRLPDDGRAMIMSSEVLDTCSNQHEAGEAEASQSKGRDFDALMELASQAALHGGALPWCMITFPSRAPVPCSA